MTKVAVCLLTCNREDYTERTLRSFSQYNARDPRLVLLHADDASIFDSNRRIAQAHGFRTVFENKARRGWLPTRRELFDAASSEADWIYLLENDIDTLRPFPWALFEFMLAKHRNAYCLRMYGVFKDIGQRERCLDTHKRYGHRPVKWVTLSSAPEPAQIGRIHWSAQPAVTRATDLIRLHQTGIEPSGLTMRVLKNVTSHFGGQRTVAQRSSAREASCSRS